jgi:spore germination protein YaaH
MNPTADAITALNAEQLAEAYKSNIQWDEQDRSAWFFFYRDQLREWVFFTDQRTFKERYELAQQNGLGGFCSWVLGDEDPAIWQVLPQRH